MMDLYSDERVSRWVLWLVTWYDFNEKGARDFIAKCRQPASDIAAAFNIDPEVTAQRISVLVLRLSGVEVASSPPDKEVGE